MIVPGSDKSLDKIAKELNIKPADLKDYNPNYKQGNPILVPDKIVQKTTNNFKTLPKIGKQLMRNYKVDYKIKRLQK